MKELIGKKVIELRISKGENALAFKTTEGIIAYLTCGECCSETWFSDITGVSALLGNTVNAVEKLSLDDYDLDDGRCRQDYDEAYGYKLITDKGYVDIVFRNSSNGYYGGEIKLFEKKSVENMISITDDWNA